MHTLKLDSWLSYMSFAFTTLIFNIPIIKNKYMLCIFVYDKYQ